MIKAVLIVGLKGSGKDTFAKHFIDKGYKLAKFSSLLKEATSLLAGYPAGFWETEAKNYSDHNGLQPREFITTISEALKDKYGRDIITKLTLPSILNKAGNQPLVFTDARFPDAEVDPVIDFFGRKQVYIIRVKRDAVEKTGVIHKVKLFLAKKGFKFSDSAYSPTEIYINDIKEDVTVYNNFSLEHLEEMALAHINYLQSEEIVNA